MHRLPVRALGCVNDHAAALSEGQRPTAKHLETVWWLFVALSRANEGSREIYVSKVVFLFTQRPAGPSVSTAPVHPSHCFMINPNRLINHSAGHYCYSSVQVSHKMTWTCSILLSLLNCTIEQLLAHFGMLFFIFHFSLTWRTVVSLQAVSLLSSCDPHPSILGHCFKKHPLISLRCVSPSSSPTPTAPLQPTKASQWHRWWRLETVAVPYRL